MSQLQLTDDEKSINAQERQTVVQLYIQAWTELAPDKLRTLLDQVWTPNSTYQDPLTTELCGYDELIGHIQRFQKLRPVVSMELNSSVNEYQRMGRFNFISRMPDGSTAYGTDFIEFDENNRLSRVIGFPSHLSRRQK